MRLIVNPHKIELMQEEAVNEKEIDISKCEFEFAEEITNDYVKEAYFTLGDNTYKQVIVNNQCSFPQEVLVRPATIELGVVAYLVENDEEIKRYNPTPVYFKTDLGSLKTAQNSQPITPSEMEQYEQALQDGLSEVNDKLEAMGTALAEVDNLDIDASKSGTISTVTITNKAGTTKSVQILDGVNGTNGKDGVDGKDGKDGTNGTNGTDGISPTATITKSGSTATITITDKNGTTTATVSDGTNGTNGTNGRDGYVQYTAGNNITIEDNVISATGGDLSNYYTKAQIDRYIPNYWLNTTMTTGSNWADNGTMTADDCTAMTTIVNDAYTKGYSMLSLIVTSSNNTKSPILVTYSVTNNSIQSKPSSFKLFAIATENNRLSTSSLVSIMNIQFNVAITWTDNVASVTQIKVYVNRLKYLSTENTASYTPTNDYNPATKKYVDDSITSAITTTLGGNY